MERNNPAAALGEALALRFGESFAVDPAWQGMDELLRLAGRSTHRSYSERAVDPGLLKLLCACALSAPSKSDLQQADLLVVDDKRLRHALAELLPDQTWMRTAPVFLVVLANGRRLVQVAEMREKPFPNRHLDHFFNASVDAGIVLATFLRAAEAVGLGCCPVSVIREHASEVSRLLGLPPLVVPVAGLCVGWPDRPGVVSPRLSLATTLHTDRFDDTGLRAHVEEYDRRRAVLQGYPRQRDTEQWGLHPSYGWSEDKARQFAAPQCQDFGDYVRSVGFRLE